MSNQNMVQPNTLLTNQPSYFKDRLHTLVLPVISMSMLQEQ